jgi:hypothetical protein
LKELDLSLCCEILLTKEKPESFIVLNWIIDEDDFYIAHVMYKKKKRNWDTLLDLIPILGQAAEHYDFFGNGQSRPTDLMSKMETLLYHWRIGLDYLSREGIEMNRAECYKYMLEQTTKWRKK